MRRYVSSVYRLRSTCNHYDLRYIFVNETHSSSTVRKYVPSV